MLPEPSRRVDRHGPARPTNEGWTACCVGGATVHMSGFTYRLHPEDLRLRTLLGEVQGATLADSLRKHPKAFDDLFCNMVAAGEAGGILDTILQRLSQYIEKIVKLRSAVR